MIQHSRPPSARYHSIPGTIVYFKVLNILTPADYTLFVISSLGAPEEFRGKRFHGKPMGDPYGTPMGAPSETHGIPIRVRVRGDPWETRGRPVGGP